MKLELRSYRFWLGTLALTGAMIWAGCSDEDNPDPVTVKNLKYASDLTVSDNGDGTVSLTWRASNFEGDFDGYNVYAVKMDDSKISELGLTKGDPLQLLNDEGEASDEAKKVLTAFNFNAESNNIEAASETEPANDPDEDGEDRKISFLPIHNTAEDEPVLPTCYPETSTPQNNGVINCARPTAEADLDSVESANGTVQFDVPFTLTYGEQYCFLVFSVLDGGTEISQTSTNFECIRPNYSASGIAPLTAQTYFELDTFIETCSSDDEGECPTIDSTHYTTQRSNQGDAAFYFENYSNTPYITAGLTSNCGVKSFGYRPNGFSDTTLPSTPPAFGDEFAENGLKNANGYSVKGQSVQLFGQYMYVVGCVDAEDETKSTYQWVWISDATVNTGGNVNVQMRLSETAY